MCFHLHRLCKNIFDISINKTLTDIIILFLSLCRLGGEDKQLEKALAKAGCEVHCFNPSIREAHLQDSHMWLHRLSIDWRDPNPAIMTQRQQSSTMKLSAVLKHYGHKQVMQNTLQSTCTEHTGDNIVHGYGMINSFKNKYPVSGGSSIHYRPHSSLYINCCSIKGTKTFQDALLKENNHPQSGNIDSTILSLFFSLIIII